jgi:hypothetical protein
MACHRDSFTFIYIYMYMYRVMPDLHVLAVVDHQNGKEF